MNDLVLIIKLGGKIGGPISHTHTQSVINPINNKYVKIKHTNRSYQECHKKTTISSEVVEHWASDATPSFISSKVWKRLTKEQRIQAHVLSFDEGYGVDYSYVEN